MQKHKKKIIILIIIALLLFTGIYMIFIAHSETQLGKTDTGYVTKQTYNYYNSNTSIILIAGIHPREKLSIEPEIKAAEEFALKNHVNMIIYHVVVLKDATDYKKSRYNGEHLVADFVVPDIAQMQDESPVIISHSHIPSYGEGYYVATPQMDDKSTTLANKIKNSNMDFNYYPTTGNESYKSTSATLVSKPIAISGHPTIVYEIPEDITDNDSTKRAYDLFKLCYEYT